MKGDDVLWRTPARITPSIATQWCGRNLEQEAHRLSGRGAEKDDGNKNS